jgi:hypothetical protein
MVKFDERLQQRFPDRRAEFIVNEHSPRRGDNYTRPDRPGGRAGIRLTQTTQEQRGAVALQVGVAVERAPGETGGVAGRGDLVDQEGVLVLADLLQRRVGEDAGSVERVARVVREAARLAAAASGVRPTP